MFENLSDYVFRYIELRLDVLNYERKSVDKKGNIL